MVKHMSDVKTDPQTIAKLAKSVGFICGAESASAIALKTAAESGKPGDIKKAYTLFLKLKPGHRQAVLSMLSD
jgi:hypothetical protein